MEVVILCITLTTIMCVCLVAIGYIVGSKLNDDVNKGTTQRTDGVDSDIRVYVPSWNRDRSGDQSDYLGLDDEAVKNILYVMRMSVRYSEVERLAIDYCIDRLEAENG